jgi:hypothetical protein
MELREEKTKEGKRFYTEGTESTEDTEKKWRSSLTETWRSVLRPYKSNLAIT